MGLLRRTDDGLGEKSRFHEIPGVGVSPSCPLNGRLEIFGAGIAARASRPFGFRDIMRTYACLQRQGISFLADPF